MSDCTCTKPQPDGAGDCGTCGGFACHYANAGQARCPRWRCDCFVEEFPDSPFDLHPELFTVRTPTEGKTDE